MRSSAAAAVAAALALAVVGHAQPLARIATSVDVLVHNAVFFQNRTVTFLASPVQREGFWYVALPAPQKLVVLWRGDGPPATGTIEVRGTFLDVGRYASDDSRLAAYGLTPIVQLLNPTQWPARDTFFAVVRASGTIAPDANDASLRAIVLAPQRFEGRTVTIRGRFRGQNLYGDVPFWPRQSKWDFVLQSGDAALWVTGQRPHGDGFDFDPGSRRDTTKWLQATGQVKLAGGLAYLDATKLQATPAIDDEEAPSAASAENAPPPAAPPSLVFTAPTDGEAAVPTGVVVRIQFSREMREASFDGHVRVRYAGDVGDTPPAFTITQRPAAFAIELHFAAPLRAATQVIVDLLSGIVSREGTPLAPSSFSFTTGSTP